MNLAFHKTRFKRYDIAMVTPHIIVLILVTSLIIGDSAQAQDDASLQQTGSNRDKQPILPELVMDGFRDDWASVPAFATETTFDAPGNENGELAADFSALSILDDSENLYFLLDVTNEILAQNDDLSDPQDFSRNYGSDIRLYIDGDNNSNTGDSSEGIELEISWGNRFVNFFRANGSSIDANLTNLGSVVYPTTTSDFFEIVISKDNDEFDWLQSNTIRFYFEDLVTGDRFPDSGLFEYDLQNLNLPEAEVITFNRHPESQFRLLVHNVEFTSPANNPGPYVRILNAVQPDIISWQEVQTSVWDDRDVLDFFNSNYPNPLGGSWNLTRQSDTVTLSPWPVLGSEGLSGNHVGYFDLPNEFGDSDLVLYNAHTPCCDNDSGRDFEHDQISAHWKNLLNGTDGDFTIDAEKDLVVMVGDFNMVGIQRQLSTLRDGDLINNNTFGADFSPGRDNGSLIAVETRHNYSNQTFTWYSPGGSFAPGRLDWIFYSDDVAELNKAFAILANDLPQSILTATGLQGNETPDDHLPLVLDFSIKANTPEVETDMILVR